MKYYRTLDYSYDGGESISIVSHADSPDIPWLLGVPWHEVDLDTPIAVTLSTDQGGDVIPDIFLTGLPMFSPKVLEILAEFGVDNFDLYPAEITTRSGATIDDYQAFYLIGALACMDRARSDYHELRPGRTSVGELVVDAERTLDMPLFRLAEDPLWLLIRDDLKQAFEDAEVVGAYYTPVESS